MSINFRERYKDYAIFCPAISAMYVKFGINANPKRPIPGGLTQTDLNFLDPNNILFHIPYALYSAGQACKTKVRKYPVDMITTRDRKNTTIIGDSGGYQIQTNVIKWKGDETRNRMINWLQKECDWSMILDFPTGGIDMGNVAQHTTRLNEELKSNPYHYTHEGKTHVINSVEEFCELIGYKDPDHQRLGFGTCLLQTIQNNEWFIKNRTKGKTNFLNVIQGRTVEESQIWYDHVKKFDFEAWSLAGPHRENFTLTMMRLIEMWDDGLLENKNWLHFLGVGKLAQGCVYTTIQRQIREHINPNFTISYDVSSPFTTAAFGNILSGYTFDRTDWYIHTSHADGHTFLPGGADAKMPFLDAVRLDYDRKKLSGFDTGGNSKFIETEIGKRLLMEDICVNDDPKYTSCWDIVAYACIMNHNLQVQMEAVFDSQDFYDHEDVEHVPPGLLKLKHLIPEIFQYYKDHGKAKTFEFILANKNDLNYLAGSKARDGVHDFSEFEIPETEPVSLKKRKNVVVSYEMELFDV